MSSNRNRSSPSPPPIVAFSRYFVPLRHFGHPSSASVLCAFKENLTAESVGGRMQILDVAIAHRPSPSTQYVSLIYQLRFVTPLSTLSTIQIPYKTSGAFSSSRNPRNPAANLEILRCNPILRQVALTLMVRFARSFCHLLPGTLLFRKQELSQ